MIDSPTAVLPALILLQSYRNQLAWKAWLPGAVTVLLLSALLCQQHDTAHQHRTPSLPLTPVWTEPSKLWEMHVDAFLSVVTVEKLASNLDMMSKCFFMSVPSTWKTGQQSS